MSNLSPLHSANDIAARVADLGARISSDYSGRALDIVYAVNGGAVFCADLIRHITVPVKVHPLGFTSYPKPTASGEVRLTLDVADALYGHDVLLVEGIIVSGRTPKYIADILRLRGANVSVCAIGVKRKALAVDLPIGYVAFELGGEVVVGYGVGEGAEKALPYLAAKTDA